MVMHTLAIAQRVLRQLINDRRFLALSILVPVFVVFIMDIFFEAVDTPSPFITITSFIIPGGAFIVHFITYVLCAIVLVRERTAETLERMFVSGYRQIEIIGGYLVAYSALATLQSFIVLVELNWLFELDKSFGTLASIYVVMWLLAVVSIALGILVSNFARNEGQVFPFIPMIIVPSMFLSGMLVEVDALPDWAQVLSRLTPLYYATEIIHDLNTADHNLGDNLGTLGILIVYGLVVLFLAAFTLQEYD